MAKTKTRNFVAFYFLKNCKLDNEIDLGGNIRLIPFEGFSLKSQFDLIDKFSEERGHDFGFELGPNYSQCATEGNEEYKKKIKMAVLCIPIKGDTEENVKKTLDPFAGNVMFLLSAFKNTYVERVGYFAVDVSGKSGDNKHINYYFDLREYKDYDSRSLIDDNQLTKILAKSMDIHKTIEKYSLVKHSKQLYYEYTAEENEDWRFLRLWNILEIQAENRTKIAKTKLFDKNGRKRVRKALYSALENKDINGSLKSKKIESFLASLNYPPIKDKIRKMLEEYQITVNQIDDSHDIVDQVYQYRNCLIHYGCCTKKRNLRAPCENWCKNSRYDSDKLRTELRNFVLQIIFPDFNVYLRPEKKQK